ncbi:2-hydroxy-6-oxononadienedioate/2-hydroxy-6-oxononatrienedioate hydrolase [Piscirickettsia salmonis]|uniref:alpha/beta fold hydrolase n=1 Tax=Piscirickettsia salmonis TaxID=1238 RepID=UPI0012BACDAD|nr:alpha/beta hydrolase [Piscirickettsia salmonis]QGP55336.1 2-hydroxy-6-oxononadienedioate/2-hydroxy-6-oxononatrienedioate hydrolase [Piscirickettsia salmonis]QGP58804.1 2-hydroxy-6-oxononadienedioate/2-hydroxy-6-oxononatrienedioate hydrolase [Piscirickettsia salmonis]QGP64902.1 2-hydroxy-6-oxononadienedioate/2-hydroxy-6-oxononatrienedioate hydrolase [Piscirickettsia salmonis]
MNLTFHPSEKKIPKIIIIALISSIIILLIRCTYAAISTQSINIAGHTLSYNKTGKGKNVLLLLHGYLANKEQWNPVITNLENNSYIKKNYTIIAPDLPGYGHSKSFPAPAYRLDTVTGLSQTQVLYQFLHALHLSKQPIHLAGNSMGGLIQVLLTKRYPTLNIRSITFIGSPAGVALPSAIMNHAYNQGYNLFLPSSKKQFDTEIRGLIYHAQAIINTVTPAQINTLINDYAKNYKSYSLVWEQLNSKPYATYFTKPTGFQKPVAIFWGKQDRLYPIKNKAILTAAFNNIHINDSINESGHLMMLEKPETVSDVSQRFADFLKTTNALTQTSK